MNISKEDKERIEKKSKEYGFLVTEDKEMGRIEASAWKTGATHEHLTQVLPLREKLAEKDKEIEDLKRDRKAYLKGTGQALDESGNINRSLKEENERLKAVGKKYYQASLGLSLGQHIGGHIAGEFRDLLNTPKPPKV